MSWTSNICIIAAEASGDINAALLVESLKEQYSSQFPNLEFWGVAGPKMRSAGVKALARVEDISVMGFAEVLSQYLSIRLIHRRIEAEIQMRKPDLVILVDAPSFNLRIAEMAHQMGCIVHYHIPPKVWAHGSSRLEKLRDSCHLVTCVLPFEERFLRAHQVAAHYVGHPIKDKVSYFRKNHASFVSGATVRSGTFCVGLLPGSRKAEIRRHLPVLVKAFEQLRHFFENLPGDRSRQIVGLIPVAETLDEEWFARKLKQALAGSALPEGSLRPMRGSMYSVLSTVNYAWVCSGTATLETCFFEVPHCVFYRTSRFSYQIASRIVKVQFASLVNLIACKEVCPEFLQDQFTPKNLCDHAIKLLEDPVKLREASSDLAKISDQFLLGSSKQVGLQVQKLMNFWADVPRQNRVRMHRLGLDSERFD